MLRAIAISLLACLPASANVDQALRTLDEGQPLGHVSYQTGREAIARIDLRVNDDRLTQLVAIARKGGVRGELTRALQAVILRRGRAGPGAARALAALPPDPTGPRDSAWISRLTELLEPPQDSTDAAVLTLLVPIASGDQLAALYRRWLHAPARIDRLLRSLGRCRKEAKLGLLRVIERTHPPSSVQAATIAAAQDLAADEAAARQLVSWLESGRLGPQDAFLHAAGLVPPVLWDRAAATLLPFLQDEQPERRAAAILGCARLFRSELLEQLPRYLAPDQPQVVRLAALAALVPLGYRDRPTLQRLIELLSDEDPAIRVAAQRALEAKSGKQPMSPKAWALWLAASDVPASPPDSPQARLGRQRALAARGLKTPTSTPERLRRSRLPRVVVPVEAPAAAATEGQDPPSPTPGAPANRSPSPAQADPDPARVTLHPGVAVALSLALLALLAWAWSLRDGGAGAPVKLALPAQALVAEKRELLQKLPDPPTAHRGHEIARQLYDDHEAGNSTRLERLQSALDLKQAGMLDPVRGDDSQVIASFRAALESVQRAHHHAPSLQSANAALAEIHALGSGLGDHPIDTATFEALQRKVEDLESRIDVTGLTEMARESCFLLLQVAHCLRAGAELPADTAARWSKLLAGLGEQVRQPGPSPGPVASPSQPQPQDAGTQDISAVFGAPPPADAGTVDVDQVFQSPPSDPETLDVDAVFDAPRDAGTQDVDQVFDAASPDESTRARRAVLERLDDPGMLAVVTYAFQQGYLEPEQVRAALAAADGGSLLPQLRPHLTPQQVSELTVIFRRAADRAAPANPADTKTETAGFDSVFPEDDAPSAAEE